jgi:hypothetical protein
MMTYSASKWGIIGLMKSRSSISAPGRRSTSVRSARKMTSDLATLAQSGKPLFGIQESNAGKVVVFDAYLERRI